MPEMSADSTALMLVRMLLGGRGTVGSLESAEELIRSASSFSTLVGVISTDLSAGIALDESESLNHALAVVVEEVASRLARSTAQAHSSIASKRIAAVASPTIHASGQTILDEELWDVARMAVTVADGSNGDAIRVSNTTPLYWAVHTANQQGTKLPPKGNPKTTPDGRVVLEPASFSTSVLSALPAVNWFISGPSVELSQMPTEGFNLVLAQTEATRQLNWERLTYEALTLLLDLVVPVAPADACIVALAKQANETLFATMGSEEVTIENLDRRISTIAGSSLVSGIVCEPELASLYKGEREKLKQFLTQTFPRLMKIVTKSRVAIGAGYDGLALFAMMNAMAKHQGYAEKTFGVCQKVAGAGTAALTPCATSLRVKPLIDPWNDEPNPTPTLLRGAQPSFPVQYLSQGGDEVVMPASASIDTSIGPVQASLSAGGLSVLAISSGTFSINLKDRAMETVATTQGAVTTSAAVTPQRHTLAPNESVKLRLVDSFGWTVVADNADVAWSSSSPDVAVITTLSGLATPTVRALRASSVPVTLTAFLDGEAIASAQVEVVDSVSIYRWPQTGEIFSRSGARFSFSVGGGYFCNLQLLTSSGLSTLDARPCDIVDDWGHSLPRGEVTVKVSVTRSSDGRFMGEASLPLTVYAGQGPSTEDVSLRCTESGVEGHVVGGGPVGQLLAVVPENGQMTVDLHSCGAWTRTGTNECKREAGQPPETRLTYSGRAGSWGLEVGFWGALNFWYSGRSGFILNRCS